MRKSYLFRYVVLCSKYLINVYYKPLQKKNIRKFIEKILLFMFNISAKDIFMTNKTTGESLGFLHSN
jgi:hypothetical protein